MSSLDFSDTYSSFDCIETLLFQSLINRIQYARIYIMFDLRERQKIQLYKVSKIRVVSIFQFC